MRYTIQPQLESNMLQDEPIANTSVGYGKKNTIQATVKRNNRGPQARRAHSLGRALFEGVSLFLSFITYFFFFSSPAACLYGISKVGQGLSSSVFLLLLFVST